MNFALKRTRKGENIAVVQHYRIAWPEAATNYVLMKYLHFQTENTRGKSLLIQSLERLLSSLHLYVNEKGGIGRSSSNNNNVDTQYGATVGSPNHTDLSHSHIAGVCIRAYWHTWGVHIVVLCLWGYRWIAARAYMNMCLNMPLQWPALDLISLPCSLCKYLHSHFRTFSIAPPQLSWMQLVSRRETTTLRWFTAVSQSHIPLNTCLGMPSHLWWPGSSKTSSNNVTSWNGPCYIRHMDQGIGGFFPSWCPFTYSKCTMLAHLHIMQISNTPLWLGQVQDTQSPTTCNLTPPRRQYPFVSSMWRHWNS